MLQIYDDVFDKQWLDEISLTLSKEPWYSDNIANRKTWPYGNKGTHLLLGNSYFQRINDDKIDYNTNKNLSNSLIDAFTQIKKIANKELKLIEISSNLQFNGMDGTLHTDGTKDHMVYILMLCNEIFFENMGGEFYHQTSDTKVPFVYGRLIEQSGTDLHQGLSFNKSHVARFSIKWVGAIC
tara:strand:+ start:103 stop:648 length:546 start_codon:yes stop_codon:yes gene_type:complete